MKDLSLEEKIGQMLIIRMYGNKVTDTLKNMIEKYKIGGVILYSKNYNTYSEMISIINEIKKINRMANNVPIFISIDQEGGRVNRMPSEFKNLKSAKTLADKNNIDIIKEAGHITAKMLEESGFNLNFAPVLDIQRFDDNHAIGNRCYGKNEEEVIKNGIEIMKQMQEGGVIPVIKHFPGHGATQRDSHFLLPKIDKSMKNLEKEDILPFDYAIREGADAIMVGHLMLPDVDTENPASLSNIIIQKYLRDKYKFNGLIMTDDLKMRAIKYIYGYKEATMRAIKAGNDIIMIGSSYSTIKSIIKKIKKQIKDNKINIKDINKSIDRIISIKEKYKINDNEVKGTDIDNINTVIDKINNS